MKANPTPAIDLWNQDIHEDMLAYDIPQVWILVTPVEFQALQDGVVGSALRVRLAQSRISDEPLTVPD